MLNIHENLSQKLQIAPGSLYRSLVRWAELQPAASCLVEVESGRTLTYRQMLVAVNAMRLFLGDVPQTLVLSLPGGMINAVIWISALSGGHRLVPISPTASEHEKRRVVDTYQPDVLFVEQREDACHFSLLETTVIVTLHTCEALIDPVASSIVGCSLMQREGHVCLTTSGTTGEPKGVVLRERQLAWTAEQVRRSHGLTTQDRGLTVLPFFHVNAPVVSLCSSILAGSAVVIARHFSRSQFWSWVERYQVTWASLVPTIVAMLLSTEQPDFLPGTLRFVRTGSAPLPASDLRAFEARFGIPVIETYGLSEAASQVVANPVPPGKHKAGSAGLPVGVQLRICVPRQNGEDALTDVIPGEIGEICIAGPAVITAYQNNAGQDSFQHGWFRSGDLGYLDADGYLFITGRLREVINRGGENIAPREIEEVLLQHPAVQEAAVVGRPDPLYGEQVVAYIVVREEWNEGVKQSLLAHARRYLSAYKVPIDFMSLDALPRNATGKVERKLLQDRERQS
ncbi:AMP-binding protein [Dictyobacter formicarum]|uniref:AMP-dependent ligase n=1 Tax=Dictyobacter formicarum TaxID=2778368 RepID=A0ABQ3VLB6_9CHLR|nr:AMP-binding protein [Dictyobacter formicarum]GHO86148.1 AMP-dependent ligase [Dictyobacter formicarum]